MTAPTVITLSIPYLPDDVDMVTAALAYADWGWYVLPVKRGTKHPGSVVGEHWQTCSSRDPKQIAAWFAGTTHEIVLHCGRSGALVFDVDHPDKLPELLRKHLDSAPFQSTRPDVVGRGHYVFAMPPGRTLGNGTGRLPKGWGEIRGLNGVIKVFPSSHADGGEYRWGDRYTTVPVLPDEIADLLDDATPASDPASDAEVAAFLAAHTEATRPEILAGWVKALGNHFAAHASRHDSTVSVLTGALKEARAGYYPAQDAVDTIRPLFLVEVAKPPASADQNAARSGKPAADEFDGILSWAVAQALDVDLDEVRARVDAQMPGNVHFVGMAAFAGAGQATGNSQTHTAATSRPVFWDTTTQLKTIRDFARARRVSPWAVLGTVLAHLLTLIPPTVQIHPYVGRRASLNLYVGLVGESGDGKGAAEGAARDVVLTDYVYITGPGSGEGINHLFAHYDKADAKAGGKGTKFHRHNVYFSVNEVDTLNALDKRAGSTLLSQLCKAWSGESLTFAYVDQTKALIIPAHSYRLCMVVGIQPGRAGVLLDATDSGVPQRFLWLPVLDSDMPDVKPSEPAPLDLMDIAKYWPDIGKPPRILELPPSAAALLDRNRVLRNRRAKGADTALDGHLPLCRTKVAIALMLLHGETKDPTELHWDLAGEVMAVSQATRAGVEAARKAKEAERNRQRGMDEGVRSVEADAVRTEAAIKRVAQSIERYLHKQPNGEAARSAVRRNASSKRSRAHFDEAVERLDAAGRIAVVSGAHGETLRLVIP